MFSDYRAVMIPEYRIFFFTFSIIRCNDDRDLFNVLFNNSEFLLDILISDFFVVVVNSGISYKSNVLAFLAVTVILKSLFYLILFSRYYSILFFNLKFSSI